VALTNLIRVLVGPSSGSVPTTEVSDHFGISYTGNIDDGSDLTFSLPGGSQAAGDIDELATDCWVYLSGVLLQRFRITNVEQEWDEDGGDVVSVQAFCYRRIMYHRLLNNDLTFAAATQASIVLALIADTQAALSGDLGITTGTSASTATRTIEHYQGENIGKILEEITRLVGGPRITINGQLEVSVQDQNTWPVQAMPIIRGVTARSMVRASGADLFANVVQGQGDVEQTSIYTAVAASVTAGTDPRGRWESAQSWGTEINPAGVVEKTDGELQERISPLSSWTAIIEPSRFLSDLPLRPGDIAQLVVPRSTVAPIGVPAAQVTVQCQDLSVEVTPDGELVVAAALIEVP
jgi:hypothetical protein